MLTYKQSPSGRLEKIPLESYLCNDPASFSNEHANETETSKAILKLYYLGETEGWFKISLLESKS
jgi:hypothetical protein